MATFFKSEEDKRAAIKLARSAINKIEEQRLLAYELLAVVKRMPVRKEKKDEPPVLRRLDR